MRILFVSLGCDKNLVDSEEMLGDLTQSGYEITDDEELAEAAVVNTCCFINDAKKESIESILDLAQRRTSGQLKALIVTGCLAQRYSGDILREIPEVDAVIGTTAQETLIEVLDSVLKRTGKTGSGVDSADGSGDGEEVGEKEAEETAAGLVRLHDLKKMPRTNARRVLTTADGYGYLRIAEGCSKHCTYARIEDIRWIRLLYCYPEEITPELIETMRDEPKVLHYIDMPIQHASDSILKKMGRRTSRKELEEIIGLLRREIPDICIRTTLITGFPTETEKDHKTLMSFVRRMRFDRLGVFAYSREEGTPASKMSPQVPSPVKTKRRRELMLLQQEIAFRKARRMKGKTVEAIVEGRIVGEDVYTARTYMDTPGVDGTLFVETGRDLMTGDFIRVKVTGSDQYDLIGVPQD